ncbi:MAG: hypothetical protein M5U28_25425 [Sandaracinaceae bacterium]|nr:hypothetical protein [Sandaracinaceae bacterium]
MSRAALSTLCAGLALAACGGSAPSEATIYYDPALRPGVAAATGPDHELLARLGELPPGEAVNVGDRVYEAEAPYTAASGRLCRAVRVREPDGARARLACEAEDGWVFVPDVLSGEAQ